MPILCFDNVPIRYIVNEKGLNLLVQDVSKALDVSFETTTDTIYLDELFPQLDPNNLSHIRFLKAVRRIDAQKLYVILADDEFFAIGEEHVVNNVLKDFQMGYIKKVSMEYIHYTHDAVLLKAVVHKLLSNFNCEQDGDDKDYFADLSLAFIKSVIKEAEKLLEANESVDEINESSNEASMEGVDTPENNVEPSEETIRIQNWLNDNVERKDSALLKLKDVCFALYQRNINNHAKSKVRKEIEEWIKTKHPMIKWEYQDTRFQNEKYRGWCHLSLIERS